MKAFNDANEMFNCRLKALVDTLNKDHPDAKFTYVNSFGMFQELKDKAPALGTYSAKFLISHLSYIYNTYIDACMYEYVWFKVQICMFSGFKNPTDGCCGVGKYKGQLTCLPGQTACPNRDEYIFWDAYHPTEATNRIIAKRAFTKESPTDVHPYDIHTLLTLK